MHIFCMIICVFCIVYTRACTCITSHVWYMVHPTWITDAQLDMGSGEVNT